VSRRRRDGRRGTRPDKPRDIFVPRPFHGLADEPQWIALRELVPAATAPLTLRPELIEEYGERPVMLATLLPMAWPAMLRPNGVLLVGLQRQIESGDANRDVAASIVAGLAAPAPGEVAVPQPVGEGPRLADVIVDGALAVTMYEGFEFWVAGGDPDPSVTASLERANESIFPTVQLAAAPAAYWCQVPERAHVRWVLPEPEDTALGALARLSAAGTLKLREDTKFAGMFRSQGLLVPVWDVPREVPAAQWEEPLAALAKRYADALAIDEPPGPAVRRARHGLIGRQLTLR
jgi:hypothetical protein